METELVIQCVGLAGLTITVSGADHSIPIGTGVLRVTTLCGTTDYTFPQLPVIYNLADLNGSFTISDGSGRALYRWRLHPTAQPKYHLERERRSPPVTAPPSHRIIGTPPISPSGRALSERINLQNDISDVKAMVEDSDSTLSLSFLTRGLPVLSRTSATTFREGTESELYCVQSVVVCHQ